MIKTGVLNSFGGLLYFSSLWHYGWLTTTDECPELANPLLHSLHPKLASPYPHLHPRTHPWPTWPCHMSAWTRLAGQDITYYDNDEEYWEGIDIIEEVRVRIRVRVRVRVRSRARVRIRIRSRVRARVRVRGQGQIKG